MPKTVLIKGGESFTKPLRVTHSAGRWVGKRGSKRMTPSVRIKDPNTGNILLISRYGEGPALDPLMDSLEIGGVHGTIAQWQEVLCPLLKLVPNYPGAK